MDATQGSPQKGRAGGDSNALIPVTIHMLEKAVVEGTETKIDGRNANMMIVVGAVEEFNRHASNLMEFVLNDSTGKIKIRYFISNPDLKMDSIKNGMYVTAVGTLKNQPSLHFSVVALHPVKTPDEISHHIIDVAHSSLRHKGKMASKQPSTTKAGESLFMTQGFSSSPPPAVAAAPRPMVPTSSPVVAPKAEGPLSEQIAAFLSSQQKDEGVAFTELTAHFNTVGAEAVKAAIDVLLDDGTAYTTIDDHHFAAV